MRRPEFTEEQIIAILQEPEPGVTDFRSDSIASPPDWFQPGDLIRIICDGNN